jgi:hypothetical protein
MSKRKRALSSSDRDSDTLALTRDNLRRLQESLSPPSLSPNMSRQQSPTRTKNNLDARAKLEAYHIYVDTGRDYPPALAHFVKTIIRRPREANAAPSPNAKNIVKMRRWAAGQNERTAIGKVAPYLLFVGEADCDFFVPSTPHITAKHDIGLNKFFLPPAPTPQVAKTWALSRPPSQTRALATSLPAMHATQAQRRRSALTTRPSCTPSPSRHTCIFPS